MFLLRAKAQPVSSAIQVLCETYIVHRDTSHGGRQVYWFDKYNGKGEVEDSFTLSAEYWDSEDDHYNENSDFTFRDKKITMEEYESLVSKMLGN